MIQFKQKGDFKKLTSWMEKTKNSVNKSILDKYGKLGVEALKSATPVDSGTTASSWYYRVEIHSGLATLSFLNSNTNKGVPIAIILQYGHGTGTGGWVEGRDYINPALRPIFDQIAEEAWKEVAKS